MSELEGVSYFGNWRRGKDADAKIPAIAVPEHQRGMRSFLTWAFVLAQIAAAEALVGSAPAAAATTDPASGSGASAESGTASTQIALADAMTALEDAAAGQPTDAGPGAASPHTEGAPLPAIAGEGVSPEPGDTMAPGGAERIIAEISSRDDEVVPAQVDEVGETASDAGSVLPHHVSDIGADAPYAQSPPDSPSPRDIPSPPDMPVMPDDSPGAPEATPPAAMTPAVDMDVGVDLGPIGGIDLGLDLGLSSGLSLDLSLDSLISLDLGLDVPLDLTALLGTTTGLVDGVLGTTSDLLNGVTGTATALVGNLAGDVLDTVAATPILSTLTDLADGLLGGEPLLSLDGAIGTQGVIALEPDAGSGTGALDDLFDGATYTDFNIALQSLLPEVPPVGALAAGATAAEGLLDTVLSIGGVETEGEVEGGLLGGTVGSLASTLGLEDASNGHRSLADLLG